MPTSVWPAVMPLMATTEEANINADQRLAGSDATDGDDRGGRPRRCQIERDQKRARQCIAERWHDQVLLCHLLVGCPCISSLPPPIGRDQGRSPIAERRKYGQVPAFN